MKVTFEFDTSSENFDAHEFECVKIAETLAYCIGEISKKLQEWYKYDSRGSIPISEIKEEIDSIIFEHVNLKKLGY